MWHNSMHWPTELPNCWSADSVRSVYISTGIKIAIFEFRCRISRVWSLVTSHVPSTRASSVCGAASQLLATK